MFVCESALEYLLMEIYATLPKSANSSLKGLGGNDAGDDYFLLENMGYRVGLALVERLCLPSSASSSSSRFFDSQLDLIKFICKDLWTFVWKKQVDNLKTNHKGVYVLTDNEFKWLAHSPPGSSTTTAAAAAAASSSSQASSDNANPSISSSTTIAAAPVSTTSSAIPPPPSPMNMLALPCGIIRGALANLGVSAAVVAEAGPSGFPSCIFQIKMAK